MTVTCNIESNWNGPTSPYCVVYVGILWKRVYFQSVHLSCISYLMVLEVMTLLSTEKLKGNIFFYTVVEAAWNIYVCQHVAPCHCKGTLVEYFFVEVELHDRIK